MSSGIEQYNFVSALNFTPPPPSLIRSVYDIITNGESAVTDHRKSYYDAYPLSGPIADWLNVNIMEAKWAVQIFKTDMDMHIDRTTSSNLLYFLELGGDNVLTTFYHEDDHSVLEAVRLQTGIWYALKADMLHSVTGVMPEQRRIMLQASLFRRYPNQQRRSIQFLNEKFIK